MRREWELEDLIACWTLDEDEFALVGNKTGATRLGFSLMLKHFELEARFPRREDVPRPAVEFMAGQVKVDPERFTGYDFTARQVTDHRKQIREFYGFCEPAVGDEDKLIVWLASDICPAEMPRDRLRAALLARRHQEKIEPPTPGRIERQFTAGTVSRSPPGTVAKLKDLLKVSDPDSVAAGGGRSFLQELKEDPGPLTLDTLPTEIVKLERVKAIGLPDDLFSLADISEKVVAGWRARAMKMYPSDLEACPKPIRLTLLAALCHVRRAEMIDGLVELLIQLVHKISLRAERKVEREIGEEFRRVHGKNGILVRIAQAALDLPEELAREVIYPALRSAATA
ncbi:hypothetical protein DP939_18365 [Spongiactinospora rosea]|uniref:DUF4158 domain-containing protein n=1 Tax=Spongiactinospora rosea TaxID=2248750 RepID=A0A366LWY5_9ACTN|nr:DUF4158 domain-containing protein [Spongiactinospora rosea]RBQ18476.1 hypothetical protein DP939_18365 [Spongiactinospora rosea]